MSYSLFNVQHSAVQDDSETKKQTLESLNPRIPEPFLPTNWEKNNILLLSILINRMIHYIADGDIAFRKEALPPH